MPLFVAGKSGNPEGRPAGVSRFSARTVKGMVDRFVKRNVTPKRLSKIFDGLSAKDQAEMIKDLLPYVLPKQSPEGINSEEIDKLHNMLERALKQKAQSNVV